MRTVFFYVIVILDSPVTPVSIQDPPVQIQTSLQASLQGYLNPLQARIATYLEALPVERGA